MLAKKKSRVIGTLIWPRYGRNKHDKDVVVGTWTVVMCEKYAVVVTFITALSHLIACRYCHG